jgi:hypothetical protein
MQDTQKEKIKELLTVHMQKLTHLSMHYIDKDTDVGQMEKGLLAEVLQMCLHLLQLIIAAKIAQKGNTPPQSTGTQSIENKGKRSRKYLSLFGLLDFTRPTFYNKERGMLYVLDEDLGFPRDLWSYNIEELIGENASETDFRESVRMMNTLLNLNLSATGSERCVSRLGNQVEAYYDQKDVSQPEGVVHYSASFDGKGVPKIVPQDAAKSKERLGKGEKRGVKQMATVGVMSSFSPKIRGVESVLNGLMGTYDKHKKAAISEKEKAVPLDDKINDNRWHQYIHRRAFLADQEKSVDYGIGHLKSMMSHSDSKFVVPIDAGVGLEDCILRCIEKHEMQDRFDCIILDIIHVSEYVWDCVNAVLSEKSKLRTSWVRDALSDILKGQTVKFIKDLQLIIDKGNLSASKTKSIEKSIKYFTNHKHKMDYPRYLEKGYPISSALVESNCRHFVKDRMEQSGMRWSSEGAQNMLDVRAVKMNGDMVDFMKFVQAKNKKIAA